MGTLPSSGLLVHWSVQCSVAKTAIVCVVRHCLRLLSDLDGHERVSEFISTWKLMSLYKIAKYLCQQLRSLLSQSKDY